MFRIVFHITIALPLLLCAISLRAAAATSPTALHDEALKHYEADDFPRALLLFTKSMKAAEQAEDYNTLVTSIGYISNVYFAYGDYGRCLHYLQKGYEMACDSNDSERQSSFLTNIVSAYCKAGNPAHARHYYKLQAATPGRNHNVWQYYLYYNKARMALAEGKPTAALRQHALAAQWASDHGMAEKYLLYQYCEMAEVYLRMGQYAKAAEYGNKCAERASQLNDRDLLASVWQIMGEAYGRLGNSSQAGLYMNKYFSLSDSLFNNRKFCSAAAELTDYENSRSREKVDSLNGIINAQSWVIAVVSLLALLLLATVLMLRRTVIKLRSARLSVIGKDEDLQKMEALCQKLLTKLTDGKDDLQDHPAAGSMLSEEQLNVLQHKIMDVMNDINIVSNPEFSLTMLAETVGSNTKYVSWTINETYGKNFKTVLNEARVHEACRRLADREHYANLTMQALYESVGYTNSTSFIRAFKKVNGMTPSEYQKAKLHGSAL